ncbi:MAG: hypothetical protein CMK74_00565 [Pseudomonadales bacterium]|nr:hypothetical protein [Pseudomonadales bacterium]|tara:strand:- start:280 stop:726 length:447 start_codon:yes stop_codon:yes gene_type:complete
MTLLASKFDVKRGYPNGSALKWDFPVKKTGSTYEAIAAGKLVSPEAASGLPVVSKSSTPDTSQADNKDVWLVVEGNDDYSGTYVQKVAALRIGSGLVWKTSDYAAGTYAIGTAISWSSGQVKVKGSNEQIIGYVIEVDSTNSTVTIAA